MGEAKKRRETKVLLLDSDREDLERLATALREEGIRAVTLSHFDVAPPLYGALRPDLAIVSSNGKDLGRMDVVARLRQLSSGTLPLLYLIQRPDAEARQYFLEKLHAADVLLKPVDTRELISKIRSWVRIRRSVEKAARAASELRTPVLHDALTGACNRSFLLALIAYEARRAERHGGSFSILVSALENFEQFKKAFGHEWVKGAVSHASKVFQHSKRDCDVLARIAENQFAILLPGTGAEGLPVVRSRLRGSFQRSPFEFQGRWMKTPISMGASSFPEVVGTAKFMLAAACQDLRRSRESQGSHDSQLTA